MVRVVAARLPATLGAGAYLQIPVDPASRRRDQDVPCRPLSVAMECAGMLLGRHTDRYLPNDAAPEPEFPSERGALVKLRTAKVLVAGSTLRQPGGQERDGVELAVRPE
jgi:hypothetical protein